MRICDIIDANQMNNYSFGNMSFKEVYPTQKNYEFFN